MNKKLTLSNAFMIIALLFSFGAFSQEGCTDMAACNYDASATVNDGSCTYPGCTNSAAINYNPDAGCATNNCQCMTATSLHYDDFENFAPGQGISLQSNVWNTWTGSPQEDGPVSTNYAFSGTNSVRIAGQQTDLVLPVPQYTYGSYDVNFKMFVTNQGGYFNMMHQWSPSSTNYQWAMDAFFDIDGTVSWVTGGVAGGGNYTAPLFTWFDVQLIVDITNDLGSFYIDGNLLQTWQWSLNNANGSPGLMDFVAVNFYGTNTASGDGLFFIDNVSVDHIALSECNIPIGCPSGCTDALACNFLPTAQCDDGSCYYTDFDSQIAIPNGSFENWNSSQGFPEADNWSSLNALSFATGAGFGTTQLSPGVSGDYYCKLTVMPNNMGMTNPAAAFVGDYNFITGTGSNGFPVSEIPPTLFGYYRSNINAPDFAAAGVYFTKYNEALNQTDTVASGTFIFNQYITNWTPFYIDIDTLMAETPDTCQIFFVIGGGYAPIAGNTLDIDNLTFNLPCAGAGCTDVTACNFDANAIFNNGSCLYVGAPCNDNNLETSNDAIQPDCSCLGEIIIPGCNQPSACNYDMAATIDDGSCLFEGQSCDDGDPLTFLDVITADCSCQGQLESILGCTVPGACNYNSEATIDDSSCFFPGDICDDGDANTSNDVYDINCNCVGVVSVEEIESAVLVYPNPATNEVSVTLNGSAPTEVTILDITGRVVMNVQRTARINIQQLEDGIYTFRIQHEGMQWEKQVVKK